MAHIHCRNFGAHRKKSKRKLKPPATDLLKKYLHVSYGFNNNNKNHNIKCTLL
jgi:ribosomal protein L11